MQVTVHNGTPRRTCAATAFSQASRAPFAIAWSAMTSNPTSNPTSTPSCNPARGMPRAELAGRVGGRLVLLDAGAISFEYAYERHMEASQLG